MKPSTAGDGANTPGMFACSIAASQELFEQQAGSRATPDPCSMLAGRHTYIHLRGGALYLQRWMVALGLSLQCWVTLGTGLHLHAVPILVLLSKLPLFVIRMTRQAESSAHEPDQSPIAMQN